MFIQNCVFLKPNRIKYYKFLMSVPRPMHTCYWVDATSTSCWETWTIQPRCWRMFSRVLPGPIMKPQLQQGSAPVTFEVFVTVGPEMCCGWPLASRYDCVHWCLSRSHVGHFSQTLPLAIPRRVFPQQDAKADFPLHCQKSLQLTLFCSLCLKPHHDKLIIINSDVTWSIEKKTHHAIYFKTTIKTWFGSLHVYIKQVYFC